MKTRLFAISALVLLLTGCPGKTIETSKITDATTFTNFNKSFWNVSDDVKVGSVIRFEKSNGDFIVAVKYSDYIAKTISQDKIDSTQDLDQTVIFDDTKSFELAVDLIKPFGGPAVALASSQVGGKYGSGKSAKLSFKGVTVKQVAHLPLLLHVQNLDTQKKGAGTEEAELFNQINVDGNRIRDKHGDAKYWIVTKVFSPKEVEWSINDKSESGANFDCTLSGVKCGKISFGLNDSSTADARGAKTLYVVLKPFYTENGVIRIDSKVQAPRSINAS